jgi:hypothetical protein
MYSSLDYAPEIAIIKSIMNPANNPTKNSHHYNTICTLWIWISMGLVRSRINHVWNKIVGINLAGINISCGGIIIWIIIWIKVVRIWNWYLSYCFFWGIVYSSRIAAIISNETSATLNKTSLFFSYCNVNIC